MQSVSSLHRDRIVNYFSRKKIISFPSDLSLKTMSRTWIFFSLMAATTQSSQAQGRAAGSNIDCQCSSLAYLDQEGVSQVRGRELNPHSPHSPGEL